MCGLLSCIPVFHLLYLMDKRYLKEFMIYPFALGGFLYILGAVLFMFKIPERFKPGYFDIVVSA
jgi:predicted membrane channel-forming protein YqfA (hemolysin III family)